jgi:hypothetical protein
MEPLLRIFVSHSSKDRQLTGDVCALLRPADAPARRGYDVQVDQRDLEDGKPWPKQLHVWMAGCDAALLLLTKDAVASPWVLKEATILSWRLSLDPSFRLFTAIAPGVDDALLRAHRFEPLHLGTIQRTDALNAAGDALDAAKIAAAVAETLGQQRNGRTLHERIVGVLSDVLTDVKPNTLRTIAEKVQATPPDWDPAGDRRAQYIEAIAAQLLSESLGQYGGVDRLIEDLIQTADPPLAGKVLKRVAPFWVDGEAAGRLARAMATAPSRVTALNGRRVPVFTAEMYLWRAFPLGYRKAVPLGGGSAGDYVGHYRREICDSFRAKFYPNLTAAEIVEKLRTRGGDYIAVLPEKPPLPADLERLRDEFGTLHFLVWTGEKLSLGDDFTAVERLLPELDLDSERTAEDAWDRANEILENP